jgi:Arc/MetJ family transcription regulator
MRTTIILDDDLLKHAQELAGIRSKRELIVVALRTPVRLHEQSPTSDLRGKLHWEGNLDESRQDRTNAGN